MDHLRKKIQQGIERKKNLTLFKTDIEQIVGHPLEVDPAVRKTLEDFARENGWTVHLTDSGLRAKFRKIKS